MFGGLVARQDGAVVTKFQTKKTGSLFAFLALGHGKVFSRDKVCDVIWDGAENDPITLRNRLNQAISTLRRQLDTPGSSSSHLFRSDHHSIGLTAELFTTDVKEFESLIASSKKATSSAARLRDLERAAKLYHGEFLEGYDDPWILPHRRKFALEATDLFRSLMKLYAEAGQPANAVDYAYRALDLDPHDEQTQTDLISLLIESGRPQIAVRQYEVLRERLNQQGKSPSLLAESLHDKAVNRPVETMIATHRGEALVDMQLELKPALPAKSRLPVPFTRIIDRESELNQIQDILFRDRTKVVTILGIGGSGKSRLAVEVAHQVREHYDDHVYFVPLLPDDQHADVVDQIGAIVFPGDPNERRAARSLVDSMREFGKCLVVLDTGDHLEEQAIQSLSEFAAQVPELQFMVTSRKALHLPGESEFALGPLPIPAPHDASASAVASNPSVQLFLSRAQAVKPDFQVTPRTASAIAELCRRLEGLPLSLELAAGWARSLTPSQMLEQLGGRLDFLASRKRIVSPRHQTIRAVFDSTLEVLSTDLKDSFLRLSVFSGGFDHSTAARVCPKANVPLVIQDLLESCLVQQVSESPTVARFSMLDTLREYARERTDSETLKETCRLHADCFFELVTLDRSSKAEPLDEWMLAVQTDYANIAAAMTWLFDNARVEDACEMVSDLVSYWEASGNLREGIVWLENSLNVLPATSQTKVRLMAGLSRLTWHAGDRPRARGLVSQVLSEAYAVNDNKTIQEVLLLHQLDEHNAGNLDEADRLAREGLEVSEKLHDMSTHARWYVRLGNVAMERRDWKHAREYYEKCLEYGRKAGDSTRIASALVNIGNYGIKTGQAEFAKLALLEALEYKGLPGFKFTYWIALANLARAECLSNTPEMALRWLREALEIQSEDNYVVLDILSATAQVANKLGKPELAAMLLGHTFAMQTSEGIMGLETETRSKVESELRRTLGDKRFEERFLFGRQLTTDAAFQLAKDFATSKTADAVDATNAPT